MSSLWKLLMVILTIILTTIITNRKRPSPKNNHTKILPVSLDSCAFIERISLPAFLHKRARASMTVEATMVLPLFCFFFLNLSCAMELIRLHGNLELALWEVGNRMAVYGSVLPVEEDTWEGELTGIALSYTYVKGQIITYLGRDYLDNSPLTYGADSLQFLESNLWESQDTFEVIMTYGVFPICEMTGFHPFRMSNRYYGHFWNGYEIPGSEAAEETMVYITETGRVYHRDRNCTHLKLSVRQVSRSEAFLSRNQNGESYAPCEKCVKGMTQEAYYITAEGNRYHSRRDCPGLKRTVYSIPESRAGNYSRCLRCASG